MRWAALWALLAGCGPVLLGKEEQVPEIGNSGDAGALAEIGDASDEVIVGSSDAGRDQGQVPEVIVRIKPVDCGACFELQAQASGGQPPYAFEWDDGSRLAQRRVCVEGAALALSVVALDATDARSLSHAVHLEGAGDAVCPAPDSPDAAVPAPSALCLLNPSFEGTPAVNFGGNTTFDALPWSACTNPVVINTPDIGNETVAVTGGVPVPTDGLTYLALGEGEQVSQPLCSELAGDGPVYLQLDLSRIDLSGGAAPDTEQVFLEIWGGLSVDCTQRELLWASPALQSGWQQLCVALQPDWFMTQLTLRANADMTSLNPGYLLVDNLVPVAACP